MDIQDYINKIVENGDIENMHELSYMLEDILEEIKKDNENEYKKYGMKLYKMAYGETLSKEMADEIVNKMMPYGMRWSLNEIKEIQDRYGFADLRNIDVYVVMNSAYNDYKNLFNDNIEDYVRFTIDFIEDEDAGNGKVFKYFTIISRMED